MVVKFEVGKIYVNAFDVKHMCVEIDDKDVLLAELSHGGEVFLVECFENYRECVEPKVHKIEGVMNVYPGGEIYIHKNKETADYCGRGNRIIACIDISSYNITFTEGQGL